MKSISLKDIQKYCKSLSVSRFEIFQRNENFFKQMWQDQKAQFWIQLVIALKYYISHSSTQYDDACEKELITFLKTLTEKRFNEIATYISTTFKFYELRLQLYMKLCQYDNLQRNLSNTQVEHYRYLRALTIKLKCAGTFVNLLSKWRAADVGNNFNFTPPEIWFIPTEHAEPLEAYIRSKWSNRSDIEYILGCKTEDICWWKAPAKKVDQSKLKLSTPEIINAEVSVPETKKGKLEGNLKSGTKCTDETTPLWLPNLKYSLIFPHNVTKLQEEDTHRRILKMKPLIEFSFPPLMHKKYHIVSATALDEGDVSNDFVSASAWYMLVLDTLSNPFMQFVQESYKDGQDRLFMPYSMLGIPIINEWVRLREHDKSVLLHIRGVVGSPNEQRESVEKISDFLLEPCILMQLPWEPTLLRQWLAAALIEVLKFELETVVLKHWPLSKETAEAAHQLLSMVSILKERIIFGWTIVSFEATQMHGYESHYPNLIFDHVVLPSVEILKFLCSEKLKVVIQSIEKLSWSNYKKISSDKVVLSPSCYTLSQTSNEFFLHFFGHFLFWETLISSKRLFPITLSTSSPNVLLQQRASEMEKSSSVHPDEHQPFSLNPLSYEEQVLLNVVQKNKNNLTQESTIDKVMQIITKLLTKCKHFSPESYSKITSIIAGVEAKTIADKLFTTDSDSKDEVISNSKKEESDEESPLHQLILSSILYYHLEQCIVKLGLNTTILNCILRLGAHILAREQLARIFAACSILANECPKMCDTDTCLMGIYVSRKSYMNMTEVSTILAEIQTKFLSRKEFFSNFPEEWQKPVEPISIKSVLDYGIPQAVAALETRVGRILWNVMQQNFEKVENKHQIYPDARLVQYLLPVYISFLLGTSDFQVTPSNNKKQENMLHFISNLIEHYEQTYKLWLLKNEGMTRYNMIRDDDMKIAMVSQEADYLAEGIAFALHGFTGIGRYAEEADKMPYLDNLWKVLVRYPMRTEMGITSKIEFLMSNAWYNITLKHFQVVHKICYTCIPIPSPDAMLYCHELQDLYFANELLFIIEHICCAQPKWFGLQFLGQETPEHEIMNTFTKPMRLWRMELYCVLFETEGKFNYPKNMLVAFLNSNGKKMLYKLFHAYLNVRKMLNIPKEKMIIGNFPTYNAPELDKAVEMFYDGTLKTLKLFEKKKETKKITEILAQDSCSLLICNNCGRQEKVTGTFIKCPQCEEQKYPYPDFYCNERCQSAWWSKEHMAEHLEFELGLCDFSNLTINK